MGTEIAVLALLPHLAHAARRVRALFGQWEAALSRFRPESELSYVNARPGSPVRVSALFWRVLSASIDASRATEGIFDPTLGVQIAENGYDRTFADIPADRPSLRRVPTPGGSWRSIRLDESDRTVTLPPGVHLDFGGVGKGLAVDAALEILQEDDVSPVLVDAGGDLRVAGSPPGAKGWAIAVELPAGAETITLYSGGMATSSRLRRCWRAGEMEMHHILDPRTGLPSESGLCSVSVAAATCVQADVAAKTAFILGPSAGREFLQRHGLSGLLVEANGDTIRIGNWPDRRGTA